MNKTAKRIAAVILMTVGSITAAQAASYTWDGGAANGMWSTSTNWSSNIAPVAGTGNDLLFGGTARLINTNNYTANSSFRNITFNNGAGAFTLKGNAITLYGGITNNDTDTQTIDLNMALTGIHSVNAASGSITLGGALSGTSGGLTKSGANTLTLTGSNTYGGATVISAGTLQIGAGGTTGTLGAGNVTNNAALVINRSNDITVGNLISGSGSLTQSGSGTTTLTNANTYSGATTISDGTLQVGDGGTTGTLGTGNVTDNAELIFNRNNAMTVNNAISGSGTLTQSGAGTTTLTGANSYSGATTISAGTLQVGNGGATGTLGTGNVTNNAALVFNRNNAMTVGNAISGSGTLTQSGAGTTTLTNANSYSGATTISAGTLQIGAGGTSGTLGSGNVTNNAALVINRSDALTVNNAISGSGSLTQSGAGTTTLGGANSYSGNTAINAGVLRLNNVSALGSGNLNINGGILGLGAGNFTRSLGTTAGTVQLNGNSGFAAYGADRQINLNNNLSTMTWNSTANFLSTGETLVLGAGDADATVDFMNPISFNALARTVQVNDGTAEVDARLSGILSGGAGGLTKTGSGTLEVTSNNTFTGATAVNAGALRISHGNALGTTAGGVTVASGAALELADNIAVGAEALSLNGTGISGGGALRNVSGDNSWAGTVTLANVAAHRINSDAGTLTISGGITENGTAAKTLTFGGAGDVKVNGAITGSAGDMLLAKDGAGTLILNGANTYDGTTTISDGTLQVGDGGTTGTLGAGNVINNSALAFNRNNAMTVGNAISGSGTLTQSGAGTTTLTGANSYSGATTISGGTLQIGAGGTAGTLGTGNVTNNAALVISRSDAITVGNAISGSGSLTKSGAGMTTLTGANSYSGATTISAGTLQIGAGGTAGTLGSGNVTNNAALAFNRSDALTVNNAISGSGSLTQSGAGTTALGGANSYSGNTTINAGVLRLNNASALGSGNLLFNGGVLGLGAGDFTRAVGTGANQVQWAIGASPTTARGGFAAYGADRVVNLGGSAATLIWNLSNGSGGTPGFVGTYDALVFGAGDADRTVIFQNPINLDPSNYSDTRTIQVNDGSADVDATLNGAISSSSSSTRGFTKTGDGTLQLTTANTYYGATAISDGALRISHSGALGNTGQGTVVSNGAALELNNSIAVGAEALSLNGTGISSGGALRNVSGDNSWAGTVTLADVAGAHRVNSDDGTLTIGGGITETGGNAKTLTFGGAGDVTVRGAITASAGDMLLTKDGAGTLTLTGTNTYDGGTTINGGILSVSKNVNLGSTAGTLTFANGGTLQMLNTGAESISRNITLNSGGGVLDIRSPVYLSGNITGGGGLTAGGSDLVLNRATGNNNIGAITVNSGRLFVTDNLGNIYNSSIAVGNGAILDFSVAGTLAPTNKMTFASGAGLATRSATLTVNTSNVTLPTAGTMVFNSDDLNTTNIIVNGNYPALTDDLTIQVGGGGGTPGSVTLNGSVSGNYALTKSEAGTLILRGTNTFSGPTTISGGTLVASNAMALQNSTLNYNAGGGTLVFGGGSTAYTLGGLAGNKNLALTNMSGTAVALTVGHNDSDTMYSGALSAGGSLVKTGAGTFTLGGTNTYTGLTTIEAGTLAFSSASNFAGTSGITFGAGQDSTLYATANGITLNKTMTQTAPGNYRIDAGNTLTLGGLITGSAQFRKEGGGTIILNGTNNYSGKTVINGGTLRLGTSGSIAAPNMDVVNGHFDMNGKNQSLTDLTLGATNGSTSGTITSGLGVLTVNGSMAFHAGTVAAKLAGTAAMTKSSTGTVYLTGASTYTNITTVSLGTLIVNGSLESKKITVEANAWLSGTGSVQTVTMNDGSILAVGDAVNGGYGAMTFKGSLMLSAGSTNLMDVLSASLFDVLKGTDVNALAMSGETIFDFTGNTTVTNGSSFAVLQNWGSRTIDPGAIFTTKGLDSALSLDTSKLSTTGVITVIPEPTAISLLGLAGIMMLVGRRWIFSRQDRHPKKGM